MRPLTASQRAAAEQASGGEPFELRARHGQLKNAVARESGISLAGDVRQDRRRQYGCMVRTSSHWHQASFVRAGRSSLGSSEAPVNAEVTVDSAGKPSAGRSR